MPTDFDPVEAMAGELEAALKTATGALDENARATAEATMIANFRTQNPYAPEGEDVKALKRFRADADARAAATLTPLDRALRVAPELVEQAERASQEPPDVVQAWVARNTNTSAEYFQLVALDVQLSGHYAAELKVMSWPEIRRRYEKAIGSNDLRDVGFVAAVERADAAGALNRPGARTEDVIVLKVLGDTIKATREARIPEPVRKLRGLIEYGRALSEHGHKVKGLPYWAEPVKE